MSLANCLKKMGKVFSPAETHALRMAVNKEVAKGMSQEDAEVAVVNAALAEARTDKQEVIEAIFTEEPALAEKYTADALESPSGSLFEVAENVDQGRRKFMGQVGALALAPLVSNPVAAAVAEAVAPTSKVVPFGVDPELAKVVRASKDINAVLGWLSKNNPRADVTVLAEKILAALGDTKIPIQSYRNGQLAPGALSMGAAAVTQWENGNISISIRDDKADRISTILHEPIHAAVILKVGGALDELSYVKALAKQPPEIQQAVRELISIFNDVVRVIKKMDPVEQKKLLESTSISEGTRSLDEFMVRALTDPEFQKFLETINAPHPASDYGSFQTKPVGNFFTRFVDWVRSLLGLPEYARTALDVAMRRSNQVLDVLAKAPAVEVKAPPKIAPTASKEEMRKAVGMQELYEMESALRREPAFMPSLPRPARSYYEAAAAQVKTAFKSSTRALAPMIDILESMQRAGFKSVDAFQKVFDRRQSMQRELDEEADRIGRVFKAMPYTEGQLVVSKFLADTTLTGWGYQPEWLRDNEGKSIKVEVNAEMKRQWDAMGKDSEAQKLIDSIFMHNDRLWVKENALINESIRDAYEAERTGVTDKEFLDDIRRRERAEIAEKGKRLPRMIDKPYSPLKRFGKYAIVGRSMEFAKLEDQFNRLAGGQGSTALATKLRAMKADPKHYGVMFRKSSAETNLAMEDMAHHYPDVQNFERSKLAEQQYYELPYHVLARLKTEINELGVSDKNAAALQRAASNLYIEMLSQASARKSEVERLGVWGYDEMVQGFLSHARSHANMISSLSNNRALFVSLRKLKEESNTGDRRQKSELYNEVVTRYLNTTLYDDSTWQQKVMRGNAAMLLITSPAYLMSNATQVYMMSLPKIASTFGWGRTAGELWKNYGKLGVFQTLREDVVSENLINSLVKQFGTDTSKAIMELQEAGKIDLTIMQELGKMITQGVMPKNALTRWAKDNVITGSTAKALSFVGNLPQRVEMMNRIVTGVTAYEMKHQQLLARPRAEGMTAEDHKGNAHEKAVAYASKVISESQGDYDEAHAGRVFQQGNSKIPWKLLLQFRKFQVIQLAFMVRDFNRAYNRQKPAGVSAAEWAEEKAVAKRALVYAIGHYGAMTGALGIPFVSMVAGAFAALGGGSDDDEPTPSWLAATPFATADDRTLTELAVRRALGGGTMATLLTRGLPNLVGVDLHGSIGASTAHDILPFARKGKDAMETARNTAWAALGATTGTVDRVLRGTGLLSGGKYYEGLEQLLPTGVGNAMRGFREGNSGKTNSHDVVLTPADDISAWRESLTILGLKTTEDTERSLLQSKALLFKKDFEERRSEIGHKFVAGRLEGDADKVADARSEWARVLSSMRSAGMANVPKMSDLNDYWKHHQTEQKSVRGGVISEKGTRRLIEQGV